MSKKEKKTANPNEEIKLDIPADEIWTYHIEGLQAPSVGKPIKNAAAKKIGTVILLLIAIGLSIYFSVRAVHSDTYKFEEYNGGWELIKFSNPGEQTEITVDFVDGDKSKPIKAIHEYAFNCDEKLLTVNIGKDVEKIDGKSIYSVWNLRNIHVDKDNKYFCDIDGVLYNKDKTEVICYPIDHDAYLREKAGYEEEIPKDDEKRADEYKIYREKIQTYTIPETVKKIGKLAFNYANLAVINLPEGLETVETMAFFKSWDLAEINTYGKNGSYRSLPEGIRYIGSDAFSYCQGMNYLYIPASVTYIGHHAFWDTVYKQDGELRGVSAINVALSKDEFKDKVDTGDQWAPKYDFNLFKKTVDINYGAVREK
jgi:hypothetical protein